MFSKPLLSLALPLIFAASCAALDIRDLPSPAGAGAFGSTLVSANNDAVYLSWVEPAAADTSVLKVARFDSRHDRWGDAHTVAQGQGWLANPLNFPKLAAQDGGRLTAAWAVMPAGATNPHGGGANTLFSQSSDGGVTWSEPRPVSHESKSVFFVTLQPTADGRLTALWLDGRHLHTNGGRQELYANFLGSETPDTQLDASVCDCCEIRASATPDGLIAVYRGRSADEIRDILAVNYRAGQWSKPSPLNADQWKIAGCPMNGPQVAARDRQVVATWFTAARSEPRVFTKVSADAGGSFGEPLRIDLGKPQGRVDNVILADGTAVITWLELAGKDGTPGGVYARTLSPSGQLSDPLLLAATKNTAVNGFPRAVPLGGSHFLLSYTEAGETSHVATQLVTL